MSYKYIYGPVPSRRLGRSLGVDLVPFKVCSYDCIYCQLGKTTKKTTERCEYNNPSQVMDEVSDFLQKKVEIDYLTLAGSGEPTLNSALGEILSRIKSMTDVPVVVLNNGSMLWDKEVRYELREADVVVPSMDAVTEEVFKKINRPDKKLEISGILDGLVQFSNDFKGKIYVEILFVKGINDTEAEIMKMRELIGKMKIDTVHLNTVVRPPSERKAEALNIEEMKSVKEMFGGIIPVEIIQEFSGHTIHYKNTTEKEILDLLKRRPCRLIDLAAALGVHQNELVKYLMELKRKGLIAYHSVNDSYNDYYTVA